MSQSESAYSAIANWHWTTSNTPEVAVWAPYGDVGTSQRRNGDVRTWGHVGKIGPRILPLFYHHCIPRLIDYQNIAFLGAKRHQFENGRVVNVNMYVHSGLR